MKRYTELGGSLNQRITDLRGELGLEKDKILKPSDITAVCASGLVVEVILQPFIFQRDFVSQSKRRDPII